VVTDGTDHLRAGIKVTIPAATPDTEKSDTPSGTPAP
jgi:multidrug efflux system membrane fusion protein